MTNKFKNSNYQFRHSYTNNIDNKRYLYKHFDEHFSKFNSKILESSDELFDFENLYNISENNQKEFINMNDFNDIRL